MLANRQHNSILGISRLVRNEHVTSRCVIRLFAGSRQHIEHNAGFALNSREIAIRASFSVQPPLE